MSEITREQAYRRWKKGEDPHKLAKEMGTTRERMSHILKKMDVSVPLVDRIEELEAKLAKAEVIVRIIASDKWDERLGEAVDLSCEYLAELKGQDDE